MEAAVLVPIKSFRHGKQRLATHLSSVDRELLAQAMAERVLAACHPLPVFVACDDDDVAGWASEQGAEVLWGSGLGLNASIDEGAAAIAGKGADAVAICHSDLPLATRLDDLIHADRITLVPDRRRDGTNVAARPCAVDLPAAYGGGSFARHLAAALESGVAVSVRTDPRLSVDVDTIDDCRHPRVAPFVADVIGRSP